MQGRDNLNIDYIGTSTGSVALHTTGCNARFPAKRVASNTIE